MKLSGKKSQELYNAVSEEIMLVRIKIARHQDKTISTKEIDDILFKLSLSAPAKAVDCFFTKPKKQPSY